MANAQVTIRSANWPQEQALLRQIRDQVFVQEQQVPIELEWDNRDQDATHFIAFETAGRAIATARLLPTGQLGRMAVLPAWRNRGIGSQVLFYVLSWSKSKLDKIHLHAQVKAIPFYQRAGFKPYGERFCEAGIEHQAMDIDLSTTND